MLLQALRYPPFADVDLGAVGLEFRAALAGDVGDPADRALEPRGGVIERVFERIIASSAFDASRRSCAFLRFVVEETLAGRDDRIKAYRMGTSVLQRDSGFDPQPDPIVRIEASRLRRSLERYYLIAGKDDPIRIDVPKGDQVMPLEQAVEFKVTKPNDFPSW